MASRGALRPVNRRVAAAPAPVLLAAAGPRSPWPVPEAPQFVRSGAQGRRNLAGDPASAPRLSSGLASPGDDGRGRHAMHDGNRALE